MNAKVAMAVFLLVCIVSTSCLPVPEEEESPSLIRQKRFTCDVLSAEAAGIKLNHSACASHCLTLRRRGGYCNQQGVCICRK